MHGFISGLFGSIDVCVFLMQILYYFDYCIAL